MSEHHGLGFDPTDAPAEDSETVDHRRVGVGADKGVGNPQTAFLTGYAGDPLEVDLVDDAAAGRDSTEVIEALLAPFEELVALEVALVLYLEVELARIGEAARDIDLDRVVDYQIYGDLRVHHLRVATQCHHRIPEGGDVDHGGDSCEILQDHPAGAEWNLLWSHRR